MNSHQSGHVYENIQIIEEGSGRKGMKEVVNRQIRQ